MRKAWERTAYLLGEEALENLFEKHVALFGVGGVGGYVAEALGRCGIGHFTLVDNDTVSETNINRQIVATYDTIGRRKTEVMAERLRAIHPEVTVEIRNCFFLPETAGEFEFSSYDYVIDAVDTVTAKLELIACAKAAGVPVISSMGTGNKLDPSRFEITDIAKTSVCPLAKVMRRELKQRGITNVKVLYSKEEPIKPVVQKENGVSAEENEGDGKKTAGAVKRAKAVPGSIAFVPSSAGLLIAAEVVKDLLQSDRRETEG
ncbi:MAG: tRNA threonylcarbamoyladenosine dehydratase [Lachnospiraceae bacterium]|nr:tRNA threonylcarbamoyladenosine dehydratase [Lachnospiraceae bacterium]